MEKFFTCSETIVLPSLLPEKAVWSRLGRNRYLSTVSAAEELKIKLAMHRAFEQCKPRGRWMLLEVGSCQTADAVLVQKIGLLSSEAFARFASGADFLWLGAVTVGDGVANLIRSAGTNLSDAAVYDAVGSEVADAAIGQLQKVAARELERRQLALLKERFSPGYGNLALTEVQHRIFELLKLDELQMSLTGSCIMVPEKSVTAFAVVKRIK